MKKFLNEKPREADTEMTDIAGNTVPEKTANDKGTLEKGQQKPKNTPDGGASKSLEDHISEESLNACKSLSLKLVSTSSPEFKDTLQESHNLYIKYQVKIHEDKPEECSIDQFKRFLVKSPLQVCETRSSLNSKNNRFLS